jgi:hypothetical protein
VNGHLTLGGVAYTPAQIEDILDTPVKGNATLILYHQLIAALANVAAGAQVTPQAATAIAQSLALLTQFHITATTEYDPASVIGQQMIALADILDNYNSAVGLNCSEGSGLR